MRLNLFGRGRPFTGREALMLARTIPQFVCGLTVLCALAGCEYKYEAVTVLHPDGSVDREITQPAGEGSDDGPRAAGWATTVYRDARLGGERTRDFTASGHFASPDKIPDHVAAGPGAEEGHADQPRSRLVRRYARNDYIFVVEHDWEETLSDTVTFEGMHEARDQAIDLW